ncbi:Nitroreductase [Ferrithrix thermotolerans DSM 19514]|uniref:Putative NAD(P)H nitroreductase n=1 Tax=Ferrithrix thermotolerans DSM 19514 TaxID=1121881 RepID=A0A1M4V828_9ACTN|nr:nitroreductase [Ferrithrix thermotolerans]SHE65141.1 Nitroreductase [Ferrithrix thermotolerans DSM 19514]
MNETITNLLSRRSVGRLSEPGPTAEELQLIFKAAANAPDHGSLKPFSFVVLEDNTKKAFNEVLLQALYARAKSKGRVPTEGQIQKESTKLDRAPLVVVAVARVDQDSRIPEIEQILSAAAATENVLVAAKSLGYDTMWRTGEATYDPFIKDQLGLDAKDHIIGWIYIGTATIPDEEARDPEVTELVHYWRPEI